MTDEQDTPGETPRRRDFFDHHAADYAAGRPPYPERVYAFMEEIGALRSGTRILEIGPGTGQATVELLRRGATVDAIEMGPHLAAQLRARIDDDRLTIRVDDIHTCALPAKTYDAVVAATAFHWLDAARLLPRLARALVPGGWLVVWWTVFGDPRVTTTFRREVDRIFRERLPAEHRPPDLIPPAMQTADRVRELTQGGWFGDVRHEEIRWICRQDAQRVRDLFATFPAIATLEPAQRAPFLDALAAAVDAGGGIVDDPFVTVIYATRALPHASGNDLP